LGGTTAAPYYHEDIFITDPFVEDAGQTLQNAAGVMVQFARRVQITNPVIRKRLKTYSAGFGVELQACEDAVTVNPTIRDTLVAGYAVQGTLGDSTNVSLNGGHITSATGHGVVLDYTGRTFRRVSVEGHPQIEISGSGTSVSIQNTSGQGSVIGGSWITWQSVSAADRQVSGLLAGWFCDVRAPFTGTPNFKAGSTWRDNTTGELRVRQGAEGVWVLDVPGAGGGSAPTYDNIPAGSTITVHKNSDGTWPARPTSRTDVTVFWAGPAPSPVVVASGTGGMLDNVDKRLVTP